MLPNQMSPVQLRFDPAFLKKQETFLQRLRASRLSVVDKMDFFVELDRLRDCEFTKGRLENLRSNVERLEVWAYKVDAEGDKNRAEDLLEMSILIVEFVTLFAPYARGEWLG